MDGFNLCRPGSSHNFKTCFSSSEAWSKSSLESESESSSPEEDEDDPEDELEEPDEPEEDEPDPADDDDAEPEAALFGGIAALLFQAGSVTPLNSAAVLDIVITALMRL